MSSRYTKADLTILVERFASRGISAVAFERAYMATWRACRDNGQLQDAPATDQRYFDAVFCAVDNYCSDPELRDEGEFDDQMLLGEIFKINSQWGAS
ncbi:colicin immunity domain-containing protein [Paraburkholderia aromaticivorans]|uniref:Colicin D immunity protein domain-containing protein n=1 Tax=Paraburkholderia aromaticivorans TaxID=2026199 RepID=A0A248VPS7_9BURK|nr:colicin immunity domain-containing protein [Paraburkholderia aromaticivorans]ASW01027.1 hypothetical protein CJU94_22710 [Paraburkholderia aromaticivorans]